MSKYEMAMEALPFFSRSADGIASKRPTATAPKEGGRGRHLGRVRELSFEASMTAAGSRKSKGLVLEVGSRLGHVVGGDPFLSVSL